MIRSVLSEMKAALVVGGGLACILFLLTNLCGLGQCQLSWSKQFKS